MKNARVVDLVYLTDGIPLADAALYLCRVCEFRKPGPTDSKIQRVGNPRTFSSVSGKTASVSPRRGRSQHPLRGSANVLAAYYRPQ